MPICTLRAPYERFHGKVISPVTNTGQVVYSSDKAGNVSRAYAIPDNPQSDLQVLIRGYLADCADAYTALTKTQAETWTNIGKEIERENILDTPYVLSGIAAYCSVNVMRLLADQAQSPTAITVASPGVIDSIDTLTRDSGSPGAMSVDVNSASMADGTLVFGRLTPILPGQAYNARESDFSLLSAAAPEDSFATMSSGTCTITFAVDALHQVYSTGAQRVGVEITPLTSEYFVGNKMLFTNEELADTA